MRKSFLKREKYRRLILPYVIILSVLMVIIVVAFSTLNYSDKAIVEALDEEGGTSEDVEEASVETPVDELINDDRIVIVIDAGHGGIDVGGGKAGIMEKDINLGIAQKLKKVLKEKGYHVVLTRSDDLSLSKAERVEMANNLNADAFISIHQNTYEDASVHGIETWYDDSDAEADNYNLANFIHTKTVKKTGTKDRGLKKDSGLYVIREATMPSCLIETGFITNDNELNMLTNPKYQRKIAKGIAEGVDLFFQPKTMHMTFDDGPSDKNTKKILQVLKERNIKATFFVVGENVQRNPELTKRIVEEGHTIGLHSYTHDYKKIYASKESFFKDFDKTYDLVVEVTGVEPKLFRFPGGSVNAFNKRVRKEIVMELDKRGFVYFDWNASLEDSYKNPDPDVLMQNATDSSAGKNNVVLLAHDTVSVTANMLEDIIDRFSEYSMKPLTVDTKPIQFRVH